MAESERDDDRCEVLAALALLYAGGALEGEEQADFERRLAEDQRAREALCLAVELVHGGAAGPVRPDPSYRDRVRRRLRPRGGLFVRLLRPLAWSGLGAAAAVLAMLTFSRPAAPAAVRDGPVVAAVRPQPVGEEATRTAAAARAWAGLPRSEHLHKVHSEEARRKARAEKLLRLVKTDEGRSRLLATKN